MHSSTPSLENNRSWQPPHPPPTIHDVTSHGHKSAVLRNLRSGIWELLTRAKAFSNSLNVKSFPVWLKWCITIQHSLNLREFFFFLIPESLIVIKLCQRAGCPNFTHGCPFDFRFPPYFGLKLTFNLHNNVVLGAREEWSFNQGFRNNQSSLVRYAVILTPFPLTLYTGLHLIPFNLDAITSVCAEIKLWIQNIMDAET